MNRITLLTNTDSAVPKALQTGIEWSTQISDSAFYQSLRFTYRDEQDTASPLSLYIFQFPANKGLRIDFTTNPFITLLPSFSTTSGF